MNINKNRLYQELMPILLKLESLEDDYHRSILSEAKEELELIINKIYNDIEHYSGRYNI